MTARSVADMIREVGVSKRAQKAYLSMSASLDEQAVELVAAGRPLGAARLRHMAFIAYRAARAELVDPS